MRTRIVIGAAGFIGSAIVKQLANEPDRLIAFDPALDQNSGSHLAGHSWQPTPRQSRPPSRHSPDQVPGSN